MKRQKGKEDMIKGPIYARPGSGHFNCAISEGDENILPKVLL